MVRHLAGIVLCVFAVAVAANDDVKAKQRYDHHRVFGVKVQTVEHANALHQLENQADGILLWNGVKNGRVSDVMVAPHKLAEFADVVAKFGLESTLKVENVQTLIDNQQPAADETLDHTFDWTKYRTYEEIYAWLDTLLVSHSDVLSNIVIGQSYENRTIRAVKLSHKAGNPAIIIEANIHAREWITSATATWILNELLTSQEADVVELAQSIDWYIVPVLNVDGFVYTHETNRMWRKTRQPHSIFCYGADPNRNFNRAWRQHDGASGNPCSENYAGPNAESEPELRAYTQFYMSIAKSVKLYLAFHSYGQYIMTPFGHTTHLTDRHYDLTLIALKAKNAISVRNGRQYIVGPIAEVMYPASGSSIDWVYDIEGIKLTYGFEFRDDRNGAYGYLLPADQIIPNALEAFDGIKVMIVEARALNYM